MDSLNKIKITKVLITQPFFELQTPHFAWKFIWTVQPNDKGQKYKNKKKHKNDKNPKKSTKITKNSLAPAISTKESKIE